MSDAARPSIPFIDLQAQRRRLGKRIDEAIARVLEHGAFIMGPEVAELERRLGVFSGAKHVVTCANGTDALQLGLMALGIGPGDAVLVPSFTFAATAQAVALIGATPLFVDVLEETFNLDPDSLKEGILTARQAGYKPAGVIVVDLFGQPADYDAIEQVAAEQGLWLMVDGAQSFGCRYRGRSMGAIGRLATTSFFPAKPLGCYGDGGAIFTDDDAIAGMLRSLCVHGRGVDKYDNARIGMNSRLDTLQAAILLEKLNLLDEELESRNRVAVRYSAALADLVTVPRVIGDATPVWAQYTVVTRSDRDEIARRLKELGVPTAVYYRLPLHRQAAYAAYPTATKGALPISDRLSRTVLSLPMHPYLDQTTQDRIVEAVRQSSV